MTGASAISSGVTTMTDLKPCPFCRGKAELKIICSDGIAMMPKITWHRVRCVKCDAQIERFASVEAIEAWNRRVTNAVD